MKKQLIFSFLLAGLLIFGSLTGFSVQASTPSDTLVVAIRADIQDLDPAYLEDAPTSAVGFQIYEHLVRRDFDGTYAPGLAESWEVSEDATEYTFFLREGVTFHDGTPFNAEAVKFQFERLKDPETGSHAGERMRQNIDRIELIDDYTISFILTGPNAAFFEDVLIQNATYLASPAAVEEYGEDYSMHASGTGPFIFESWRPDQEVVLRKNEDYWDGAPKINKVIFRPIPEAATQITELRVGTVDIITTVPTEYLEDLEQDDSVVVINEPDFNVRYLVFNFGNELFQDLRVRRALHHAVDIHELVDVFLSGVADPAYGPLTNQSIYHNPDVLSYEYDPDKALELLAEAGWTQGTDGLLRNEAGETLQFTLSTPQGRYTKDRELNEAVHFQFQQIGVDAQLEILEFATLIDKLREREFDLAYIGMMQRTGEPASHLNIMYGTDGWANWGDYSNTKVDQLLERGLQIADFDEREEIYYQVQDMIMEDCPTINIMNELYIIAHRDAVKDYKFTASRTHDYTKLYKEE